MGGTLNKELSQCIKKAVIIGPKYRQSNYSIEVTKGDNNEVIKKTKPIRSVQNSDTKAEILYNETLVIEDPILMSDHFIGFRLIEHAENGDETLWTESCLFPLSNILEERKFEIMMNKNQDSSVELNIEIRRGVSGAEKMLSSASQNNLNENIPLGLHLINFLNVNGKSIEKGVADVRKIYESIQMVVNWKQPFMTFSIQSTISFCILILEYIIIAICIILLTPLKNRFAFQSDLESSQQSERGIVISFMPSN